jgi:DNA uptake protein ComE-like DNA-binding protein
MPSPPILSDEQRAAALVKAAAVRTERADLKARLASGELTLAAALDAIDTDDAVANIKVLSLLESLPGVGKVKARRIMEAHDIAPSRRMRGLGANQRASLLTARD